MEDGELLALYEKRDEDAVAMTKAEYGAYLTGISLNIVKNPQDAEECVNDTYLRAWNRIPPDLPDVLRVYLGRLTRNISTLRRREKHREKRGGGEIPAALDELAECVDSGEDIEADYRQKELTEAVGRFLSRLPARDCDLFLGRYWFLYPTAELAVRTGLEENYVRTVLSRTRHKLRAYLEKEKLL